MQDQAASVAATGSGTEFLDSAVEHVLRGSGASVAMLYLLPRGENTLRLTVLAGAPGQLATPWNRVNLSAPMPVADAVRHRCLIWLGSQEELARRYPRPALVLPYRFCLAAAPIRTGDRDRGGLVLLWPGAHPPELSAQERDAVVSGCRGMGMLLQQAESSGYPVLPGALPRVLPPPAPPVPEAARAAASMEFVQRLPGGSCALDLDGTICFMNDAAAELLGAPVSELLGTLPWESLPWLDDPGVEDHYRDAVISRRQTSFTALRPPDDWLSFHLFPSATGISVRILPADRPHPTDEPAPRRAGGASGPSRAAALYHLMHLAATLTEAVSTRDVIELAGDQIMPAFRIQSLVVMTSAEGRLRIEGRRGLHPTLMDRLDGAPLSSHTPAAHVLMTGVPGFFSDFTELERGYPTAGLRETVAACAFLPLIVSGHPVGALVLAYDRPRAFDPEERALLTSIAGLLAQALDRARLYDTKDRLAHSLQAHLLPHTLPRVAGLDIAARYLPATRGMGIGGDFYDLIRLDATTAAAAIGDVQGHNVNAAALMGQVRTAVHASAGAPPDEVLARTNRLLTDLDPDLFTSCLYVHLDLAGHRARLATAGHPAPLLRQPDGRTEALDLPAGLLLGIDPASRYPTAEIPLPPGAALALFTDGLVEAPGVDFDHATAALAEHFALALDQPMESVADTLVRYAKRCTPGTDDIALLLINALGSPG
ncbi:MULTISPECIES: SpoIIE family protein phosphatase [unclassified Streptomyces]|uniref:SpoIIE family protein phosphatase n=1 Tax=unclassified Streptomyces TaxID=2593676 RepID=UPI0001C19E1D|nr:MULTISPECIES: SpoIIE family protein phosphatase [unclassified Streptomyces]MYR68041.1 SpoIIE family protein phosphatase [Streptomyces sp. SID4939]MYS00900.1 SpoIIE family protein phosphatase [Streptomyces sp. SID4940]MYT67113.1 SpoIIE family protein phosphatase [Streptomyces sp. SID8357]MYT84757.1 SpoIIE family protein phosphatase [Streptomyces sp. SID8360]MYW40891.1 SpoIIE family protein phosphatase [Streptomyces sp. SID1]MYX73291.1 SpoIIE family protein phosphatase [Streptomyces sp. SID3